ncbi:MAG: helix-turn-helix domain-containing protein [Oscillospiraceae bacterium]|nr:helix-turn-helix domain-containing protein [Oscillospiraceae bacterium]
MGDTNKIKELSLGKKIRQIRIDKKITQQELVGDFITRNMLSQIENDVASPSIKTLQKIAESLEVPLSFLMTGEHDEEFNKNYEFDDIETISIKAKKVYFAGDYREYIDIAENYPQITENKENALILGIACLEAALEAFVGGDKSKCLEYCKKGESCANNLGELFAGRHIKRQTELYKYLCQPVLTEDGEEYRSAKAGVNSDNFIKKTFDENGICRQNILAANRALKTGDAREAIDYLREAETYLENFAKHPYKKDLYKLFEMVFVKNEDYKNAHLYSSKILELYTEQNKNNEREL